MKVIAVDFDGTITNGGYWTSAAVPPVDDEVMLPNTTVVCFLEKEYDGPNGAHIVVHTARPHSHHEFIRKWMTQHGIPFDSIVCGKIRADMYIDDKAFTPEDIENGKDDTTV